MLSYRSLPVISAVFAAVLGVSLANRGVVPLWIVAAVGLGGAYAAFVGVIDVVSTDAEPWATVRNFLLVAAPLVLVVYGSEVLPTFYFGATLGFLGITIHETARRSTEEVNGAG